MSKVFYVSYDLNGDEKDYDSLSEKLREWKGRNILKSVWAIVKDDSCTCESIKKELLKIMNEDDSIIVIDPIEHSHKNLLEKTYKLD